MKIQIVSSDDGAHQGTPPPSNTAKFLSLVVARVDRLSRSDRAPRPPPAAPANDQGPYSTPGAAGPLAGAGAWAAVVGARNSPAARAPCAAGRGTPERTPAQRASVQVRHLQAEPASRDGEAPTAAQPRAMAPHKPEAAQAAAAEAWQGSRAGAARPVDIDELICWRSADGSAQSKRASGHPLSWASTA